jgi:hypothetical protein
VSLIAIVSKDLNINVRTITEIYVYVVYNGSKSRTLLIKVTMSRSSVGLALRQYTITALGRGEYPKLSTPLGLFPSGFPEGNNTSGVDNFEYSPIQRAVTVLLYRTNS